MFTTLLQQHDNHPPDVSRPRARQDLRPFAVQAPKPEAKEIVIVTRIVITIVIIIVIAISIVNTNVSVICFVTATLWPFSIYAPSYNSPELG